MKQRPHRTRCVASANDLNELRGLLADLGREERIFSCAFQSKRETPEL